MNENAQPVLPGEDRTVEAAQSGESYILVNANEATVMRRVAELIQYIDMCRCEKCFKDACALVLNQIPPSYVTTPRGTMLSQLKGTKIDTHADLNIKITQALNFVRENPQHGKEG